jgi:catechol 2,3-dioxygenase-like lactoylglutathione lyase family enzyme
MRDAARDIPRTLAMAHEPKVARPSLAGCIVSHMASAATCAPVLGLGRRGGLTSMAGVFLPRGARHILSQGGGNVVRLDHLTIPVRQRAVSRDWYVSNLGLRVEFEVAERKTVALQDDAGFTLFLVESDEMRSTPCTLTFQVDDVQATYDKLSSRSVAFEKPPQKLFWGYGAELRDPDGYLLYLWDEVSMRTKG